MNVILTSAADAVEVVQAFRAATHQRGGHVIVADHDSLAPSSSVADWVVRVPRVDDRDYLAALLDAVSAAGARALIPLHDSEVPVVAAAADRFAARGCTIVTPSCDFIALAADKYATARFFESNGCRIPSTWLPDELDRLALPERLFVRPRHGTGSVGAAAVTGVNIIEVVRARPDVIVQEEIRAPEVTIDCLFDLAGVPVHYVPRLRLRVEGGRSVRAVTIESPRLREWLPPVLASLGEAGARGPITIQVFLVRGEPVVIEVNARMASGIALTFAAGGAYPEWLLRMLEGRAAPTVMGEYRSGLYVATSPAAVVFEAPLWQ